MTEITPIEALEKLWGARNLFHIDAMIYHYDIVRAAIEERDALKARVAELTEALEPFKGVVDTFLGEQPSNERHATVYETPYQKHDGYRVGNFTFGDLRRVDRVLESELKRREAGE